MALLWSVVRWSVWLVLQLATLALHLTPTVIALAALTSIMLAFAMTTQALEHGVLMLMHRSKWYNTSNYDHLRRDFYRGYWLITLLYTLGSIVWIYFTGRISARFVYGGILCVFWWGVQLALVATLTPLDEMIIKRKT